MPIDNNNLNVPIVRRTIENSLDPKNDKRGDQIAKVEPSENIILKEQYAKLNGARFQR